MDDQGQSDKLCLPFVLEALSALPPPLLVKGGWAPIPSLGHT